MVCLTARASEGSEHTSLSPVTRGGRMGGGEGGLLSTQHIYTHQLCLSYNAGHTCLLVALSTHGGEDNSFTVHTVHTMPHNATRRQNPIQFDNSRLRIALPAFVRKVHKPPRIYLNNHSIKKNLHKGHSLICGPLIIKQMRHL